MRGRDPRPSEEHMRQTRAYCDAFLPALRIVAESCGYALAVHGSLERDIDLLAAPWRDKEMSAEYLAERLTKVIDSIFKIDRVVGPEQKPHGRKAWSIHFCGEHYIDLSVMPTLKTEK